MGFRPVSGKGGRRRGTGIDMDIDIGKGEGDCSPDIIPEEDEVPAGADNGVGGSCANSCLGDMAFSLDAALE